MSTAVTARRPLKVVAALNSAELLDIEVPDGKAARRAVVCPHDPDRSVAVRGTAGIIEVRRYVDEMQQQRATC